MMHPHLHSVLFLKCDTESNSNQAQLIGGYLGQYLTHKLINQSAPAPPILDIFKLLFKKAVCLLVKVQFVT